MRETIGDMDKKIGLTDNTINFLSGKIGVLLSNYNPNKKSNFIKKFD